MVMVVIAAQREPVDVGGSAVDPVIQMHDLGPDRRHIAARKHTTAILSEQGEALRPGGAPPVFFDTAVDARVLSFTLAVSLFTGLLFGIVPALQATSSRLPSGENLASSS